VRLRPTAWSSKNAPAGVEAARAAACRRSPCQTGCSIRPLRRRRPDTVEPRRVSSRGMGSAPAYQRQSDTCICHVPKIELKQTAPSGRKSVSASLPAVAIVIDPLRPCLRNTESDRDWTRFRCRPRQRKHHRHFPAHGVRIRRVSYCHSPITLMRSAFCACRQNSP